MYSINYFIQKSIPRFEIANVPTGSNYTVRKICISLGEKAPDANQKNGDACVN